MRLASFSVMSSRSLNSSRFGSSVNASIKPWARPCSSACRSSSSSAMRAAELANTSRTPRWRASGWSDTAIKAPFNSRRSLRSANASNDSIGISGTAASSAISVRAASSVITSSPRSSSCSATRQMRSSPGCLRGHEPCAESGSGAPPDSGRNPINHSPCRRYCSTSCGGNCSSACAPGSRHSPVTNAIVRSVSAASLPSRKKQT